MKILIADAHALFRDGLVMRVEQIAPDATIVQASSFTQVLKILQDKDVPDALILDIEMPDMPWLSSLKEIIKLAPQSAILIISATEDARTIRSVLSLGVKGYISKRADIKVFNNALKLVLEGGIYVPPNLIENGSLNKLSKESIGIKTLTARQAQVLDLIAQGKSNKQIAYDIGVSESTVKLHINALLRSLNVNNRTQAVVTAQKIGLI